jgi:hypothetical protein
VDRRVLFAAALLASLAITALLWSLGIPGFFLLLALPFLFIPRRARERRPSQGAGGRMGGATGRVCPACGARRDGGHRFCPDCGTRLDSFG